MMCTPPFPWEWFILDVAYVLTLLGGSLVLRARMSPPLTWLLFGLLSAGVGAFLFAGTNVAQASYGAAVAEQALGDC